MSTPAFTRQQVENAGDLDFDTKRRPAQDQTITAHVLIDGFHYEVCFSGQVEQLPALSKRLRVLGAEPVSAPAAAAAPATNPSTGSGQAGSSKPKAERVEPIYKPDGTACCPTHMKPLQEGRYGLFCPSRAKGDEPANDKGYCSLRFVD